MPTYLIWNENQSYRSSANARRNKTQHKDVETSKETQSRHRALFIPKEGKETLEVNLERNGLTTRD